MYRFPIRIGDRVALAPHTDLWIAGCRYGRVTHSGTYDGLDTSREGRVYWVTLDTGRSVTLLESSLLGAVS